VKPVFRNDDKIQRLKFRDWFRENMPSGSNGFVVEDLDLVVRWYGRSFDTDADGKFILVELKFGNSTIGIAQQKTFGLIDKLLRLTDPEKKRYLGYFVIQYSDEDWDKSEFKINGSPISRSDFQDFWKLKHLIPSYFDQEQPC
jgi:hypothetical protein